MTVQRGSVLVLVLCASAVAAISSKPVHVSLMSNWPRSPILLEASEFVSGEDPLLFWEFLERIQAMHLSATQKGY
jgi:hypothetical protein